MLTSDLVMARVRSGVVKPRWIDVDDRDLTGLAEDLIATFAGHLGHTRGELAAVLTERCGTGTEFQLHRGLAKLLYDRCTFAVEAPGDPIELREAVFAASARTWTAAGDDAGFVIPDRVAVLEAVAKDRGVEATALENGLFADLKDEQRLVDWKTVEAPWLLRRYNVALAQGVLLRARELTITIREGRASRLRAVFRRIKFHRLLHRIEPAGKGRWTIHLDGPLSMFRSSQKYGLQMASFLPTLIHLADWTLEASVLWGPRREERRFVLSSKDGLEAQTHLTGQWEPEEVQWLRPRFEKLASEWEVTSDPAPVDLGGRDVLVPDLVFTHRPTGMVVPLEILGYWRRGSLDSRLESVRQHADTPLLLAVSRKLLGDSDGFDDLPVEVIGFRGQPSARSVLEALDRLL